MENESLFMMQKRVDWSLLNDGMTIPTAVCSLFRAWDETILTHGNAKNIKILIDGELLDARLINQNFDRDRWGGHRDIIQIRYSRNSQLSTKLRAIFKSSYEYFYNARQLRGTNRTQIRLPEEIREYIRLYLTDSPDVLCMECSSCEEYNHLSSILEAVPEDIYESNEDDGFFLADTKASIVDKQVLMKYRKIDRSIVRKLKEFYDYRDEITGEKIGSDYGDSVVEAHHIDYFTKSQNNDSTNIIIISPNYHRIIHKNNPIFNRKQFQFEFLNGEILKLKLFDHLLV